MRHLSAPLGLLIALGAMALLSAPAHAQNYGGPGAKASSRFHGTPTGDGTTAPPPALPGAQNIPPPAEKTAGELSPNDALFDAINRGDIAAARDALNHGADLRSQNVLGMTPVELSIDLSRNDITFMLLSLRDADSGLPTPGTDKAPPPPGKTASAQKVIAAKPPAPVAAKATSTKGRQFAGPANPGTPDPQRGFLGFGNTVQ